MRLGAQQQPAEHFWLAIVQGHVVGSSTDLFLQNGPSAGLRWPDLASWTYSLAIRKYSPWSQRRLPAHFWKPNLLLQVINTPMAQTMQYGTLDRSQRPGEASKVNFLPLVAGGVFASRSSATAFRAVLAGHSAWTCCWW